VVGDATFRFSIGNTCIQNGTLRRISKEEREGLILEFTSAPEEAALSKVRAPDPQGGLRTRRLNDATPAIASKSMVQRRELTCEIGSIIPTRVKKVGQRSIEAECKCRSGKNGDVNQNT